MAQPNVIVFFTDQQRWDTSSHFGNPLDLTPNFDRVAARGTHLQAVFTSQPVCGPARSCMQTGMYATETGCFRNEIPLPTEMRTLAHEFRDGGYTTGYIGKWHLAPGSSPVEEPYRGGYEFWLAGNAIEYHTEPYKTILYDGDNQPVQLPGYRVDALTDAAIRYIDRHQDTPFYLFISYLEPHHQNHMDDYPPPDGYRERYAGRWTPPDLAALVGSTYQHLGGYFGMVRRLDEAFGRLLDTLKSLGMDENTIVLYTSDHGCHFKTRNDEYKRSCHESAIRLPGALYGPGFTGKGRLEALVSLVDLPPTLLDAAGLPIPATMQGRSIMPLLRGEATDWQEEVFVQISESQVGRAVRTRRWKYGVTAPDRHGWNDSASDTYVEQYLYDLEADPHELANLVGVESFREVSAELRERLIRRMVAAGEAAPEIVPAPSRRMEQRRVRQLE